MKEVVRVPKGIEKYKSIDLRLLPGENVEMITSLSPLSRMRSFILCVLTVAFGLSLYMLFSGSKLTASSLIVPAALALCIFFVWTAGVIEDLKGLIWSFIKFAVLIVFLSYVMAFFTSILSPLLLMLLGSGNSSEAPGGGSFSFDPAVNIHSILSFMAGLAEKLLLPYAPLLRAASLGVVVFGIIAAILVYLECRGTLYYVTDRRIVVRRKFGTVQVTTLPLDGLVEVTAFQGFFGRIFGYGDIVLSMMSGGGVVDSLAPQPTQPIGAFYQVKRRLEGVRNVWEIKDLIIALRDRYVEARYLERIEGEVRRIRQAVEGEKVKVKADERGYVT